MSYNSLDIKKGIRKALSKIQKYGDKIWPNHTSNFKPEYGTTYNHKKMKINV